MMRLERAAVQGHSFVAIFCDLHLKQISTPLNFFSPRPKLPERADEAAAHMTAAFRCLLLQ